jgi:hypothetical protein
MDAMVKRSCSKRDRKTPELLHSGNGLTKSKRAHHPLGAERTKKGRRDAPAALSNVTLTYPEIRS